MKFKNSHKEYFIILSALALNGNLVAQIHSTNSQTVPQSQEKKPNVLFIATDDMNNMLNAFGDPNVYSPNLDRLAEMGVVFKNAYNQSPLSGPSRASLLTGMRPDKTGVHDLSGKFRYAVPDAVTLPELFKNNGYYTCRIGKIFHAGVPGEIGQPGSDDPQSWTITYNPIGKDKTEGDLAIGNGVLGQWYKLDCTDDEMTDGISANVAISILKQRYRNYGGQRASSQQMEIEPFFMAVGFYRPHFPYIAPSKYFDMYPEVSVPPVEEKEWRTKPALARFTYPWNAGASLKECEESKRAYLASITFVDAQIGKMIDALEELGLMDNTIIVFWSDHGYMLGEHGIWKKQNLFEQTAKQPLLIYAPGYSGGTPCEEIVEMIDIYPTIAELVNLDSPTNIDGKSLTELLKNPKTNWNHPAFTQQARTPNSTYDPLSTELGGTRIFSQIPDFNNPATIWGRSIRVKRYRYTEWNEGKDGVELYDYQTDPDERINLANDPKHSDLVKELSTKLKSSYDPEEIAKTRETIAKNREAAGQTVEATYPAIFY